MREVAALVRQQNVFLRLQIIEESAPRYSRCRCNRIERRLLITILLEEPQAGLGDLVKRQSAFAFAQVVGDFLFGVHRDHFDGQWAA